MAARHARDDDSRSRRLRKAAACAERAGSKDEARRLYGLAAMFAANAADADAAQAAAARLGAEDDVAARAELLEVRLREATDPDDQAEFRHQLLDLAVARGDAAAIRHHAGALLESDARDIEAFLALKRAATAVGDWSVLAYLLRTRAAAIEERVERAALFYELGRLCLDRQRDTGGAVTAFEQALHADPRHPSAVEALADIAYQKQDWQRARELYQKLRPESCSLPADVLSYRRGEICEVLGDVDEAAAAYAEACRLCPSNRSALAALARSALQLGDVDTAVDASRAIIEFLPPTDVPAITAARLHVGELCQRAGHPATAVPYLEAVLGEDPHSLPALQQLAEIYPMLDKWSAAARVLSSLTRLAATTSERADLEHQLGEIYEEHLADQDRAAEAYLRAIDDDPSHLPTLRRLIDHYWRAGDTSAAMEMVAELVERRGLLAPDTRPATRARALLIAAADGNVNLARSIADRVADVGVVADAVVEKLTREGEAGVASLCTLCREVCARSSALDARALADEIEARARSAGIGAIARELATGLRRPTTD
jgi:tetratricopeptide (TPR) repeat protein